MTTPVNTAEQILHHYPTDRVGQRVGWIAVHNDTTAMPYFHELHLTTATVEDPDAYVAYHEGSQCNGEHRRIISPELVQGLTAVRAISVVMENRQKPGRPSYDVDITTVSPDDTIERQLRAFQCGASGYVSPDMMHWIDSPDDLFPTMRRLSAGGPQAPFARELYYRYNIGILQSGAPPTDLIPDAAMAQETASLIEMIGQHVRSVQLQYTASADIRKNAGRLKLSESQKKAIDIQLNSTQRRINRSIDTLSAKLPASEELAITDRESIETARTTLEELLKHEQSV